MTTIRQHGQRPASGGAPQVVIAGAGFGGLAPVRRLARAGIQATLIGRNVCTTFQPLLYQVATAGLASSDVAYPVRAITRRYGAVFRHGELAGLDPSARQVILADGAKIGYDYLIVATGVSAAHHGIPGVAEHSLGLYTRRDAIILRDRIMATIGYRSAVIQLPRRVRARGTAAWLTWLALHLITVLGGRNRISALVNLSWRYLTWRRGGGLVLGDGTTTPAPAELTSRPARAAL